MWLLEGKNSLDPAFSKVSSKTSAVLPLKDMDTQLFGLKKDNFFCWEEIFASAAVLLFELSAWWWKDWLLLSLWVRNLHLLSWCSPFWTLWNIAAPRQESWPCPIEINGESYHWLQTEQGQAQSYTTLSADTLNPPLFCFMISVSFTHAVDTRGSYGLHLGASRWL